MMRTDLMNFDFASPVNSLDAYIFRVNQIPLLNQEQEQQYAKQLRDQHDLEAARQLILAHLRYVVRIAKGYSGYGLPLGDLIQEGNIGLMKAVKRFDPQVGVRLVSFAVHWIKSEIHDYVIRNWRLVKIATTKAQRKLFFNLNKMKRQVNQRLGWFTQAEVAQVAADLGVSTKDVMSMEMRMNAMEMPYDAPDTGDDRVFAPAHYLAAESADPAEQIQDHLAEAAQLSALNRAMQAIDPRSREILQARWLQEDKRTLKQLAEKYNVSAERIRQLEKSALAALKQAMASSDDEADSQQ